MKYQLPHGAVGALSLALLAACAQQPAPGAAVQPQSVSGTITTLSADRTTVGIEGQTYSLAPATPAPASVRPMSVAPAVTVNGKVATAAALSVGQQVAGTLEAGSLSAVNVDLELKGYVQSVDALAGTLVVAGQTVLVDASSRIELDTDNDTDEDTASTLDQVPVGAFVEVTGSRGTDGVVLATKLEEKDAEELAEDGLDDSTELEGAASLLDATAMTFELEGVSVDYSAAKLEGVIADGAKVEVEGEFDAVANLLRATEVEVKDDADTADQPDTGGDSTAS